MTTSARPRTPPDSLLRRIARRLAAPAHLIHALTAQLLAEVALFLTPGAQALNLGAAAPLYLLGGWCWLASGLFAVMSLVCVISLISEPVPSKGALQFYVLTPAVAWATACLSAGLAWAGLTLVRLGHESKDDESKGRS